jgi:hypothetical protein
VYLIPLKYRLKDSFWLYGILYNRPRVSKTSQFTFDYFNPCYRRCRLISLFIYLAERRKIPILVFDSLWYQDLGSDREYYVKVKREKGEGRAQGVQGFVGVKNKLD